MSRSQRVSKRRPRLGPSLSANLVDGTVSATYQVEADDQAAAYHAGEELFLEALLFAGVDTSTGTCEVNPAGEAVISAL